MKPFVWLLFGALLVAGPLAGQNVNMANPEQIEVQHHATPEEIRDRLGAAQVKKNAQELAELCTSITSDMEAVKQGLLPKDAVEKLRRMEKLSKRVREDLTRAATAP